VPSLLKPCTTWETKSDQHYDSGANQVLDVYIPQGNGTTTNPLIVTVHGGGWESGTENFDNTTGVLASTFVRRGFAVASVRYRLSGEAPWPAQIRDVLAAIRELRARGTSWRLWPDKIGLWGFSAGAHLTLQAAVAADDPAYISSTRPGVSSRAQAVLADYPPTDLIKWVTTPGFEPLQAANSIVGRLFGGQAPLSIPDTVNRASPAWTGRPIPSDAPPIWLRHGDKDELVPYSQSCVMYDACADAGLGDRIKYTLKAGAKHADPAFYSDLVVLKSIGDWFDSYLRTPDLRH
jgi:acetyl esterase/lipase